MEEFCLLMRGRSNVLVCHGQIMLCKEKGGNMGSNITKEQINTTMALALMKHLYNQGKISEKYIRNILMLWIPPILSFQGLPHTS